MITGADIRDEWKRIIADNTTSDEAMGNAFEEVGIDIESVYELVGGLPGNEAQAFLAGLLMGARIVSRTPFDEAA